MLRMLSRERTLFQWDFKYCNKMLPFQWVDYLPDPEIFNEVQHSLHQTILIPYQSLPVSRSETAENFVERNITDQHTDIWIMEKGNHSKYNQTLLRKQHCWSYRNFANSTRPNYLDFRRGLDSLGLYEVIILCYNKYTKFQITCIICS